MRGRSLCAFRIIYSVCVHRHRFQALVRTNRKIVLHFRIFSRRACHSISFIHTCRHSHCEAMLSLLTQSRLPHTNAYIRRRALHSAPSRDWPTKQANKQTKEKKKKRTKLITKSAKRTFKMCLISRRANPLPRLPMKSWRVVESNTMCKFEIYSTQ